MTRLEMFRDRLRVAKDKAAHLECVGSHDFTSAKRHLAIAENLDLLLKFRESALSDFQEDLARIEAALDIERVG